MAHRASIGTPAAITGPMTLVAISAGYGAGGSRVAPALAQLLAVPFLDRAVPMQTAIQSLADDDSREGEPQANWLERVLHGFVGADTAVPGAVATPDAGAQARRDSDELLARMARSGRGVVLGRAAVAVLREDARVLRVRLYGPPERRIEQAVRTFGVAREVAVKAVRELDRAHDAYLHTHYGADIDDPGLYHLMIDSTAVPIDACAEIIAHAARAHTSMLAPVTFER